MICRGTAICCHLLPRQIRWRPWGPDGPVAWARAVTCRGKLRETPAALSCVTAPGRGLLGDARSVAMAGGWNALPVHWGQPRVIRCRTERYLRRPRVVRCNARKVPGLRRHHNPAGVAAATPEPGRRVLRPGPLRPEETDVSGPHCLYAAAGYPHCDARLRNDRGPAWAGGGSRPGIAGGAPKWAGRRQLPGGPGIPHVAGPGMTRSAGRCTPRSRVPYLSW